MTRRSCNGRARVAGGAGPAVAVRLIRVTPSRVDPSPRLLVDSSSPTSLPADGVAGPVRARHARWEEAAGACHGRATARASRKANEPSFLRAIAEELAAFRQTSVELMMDQARRLLNEAFLAVEFSGPVPSGAAIPGGRVERARCTT